MIILNAMINSQEDLSKFRRLYEKYKNTMFSVAYDVSRNTHDAEDIVEIALIKVIEILHKIKSEDIERPRCKNLMITITKNTAIDYKRKIESKVLPCDFIETFQHDKDVEDLYIDTENYREVISWIDSLEEKYKEVLRLRVLDGLTSKEIGKLLNITEYNVNMRFMRAKALLAQKLEERRKNGS